MLVLKGWDVCEIMHLKAHFFTRNSGYLLLEENIHGWSMVEEFIKRFALWKGFACHAVLHTGVES